MSRNNEDYSLNKRQRETQQARKAQDKAARRMHRRERGGSSEPEIITAESIVGPLPSVEEALRAMEERANGSRAVAAIPARLFVGGISFNTTEVQLKEAFAEFGEILEAVIVKDRNTGQSRGFGFVTMANRKEAGRAITELSGSELNGRRLMVNVATDRQR
jgi:RNA recognition motif-containing protein